MGTVIYNYNNGIFETNKEESNGEKLGMMLCFSLLAIIASIMVMRTESFFNAIVAEQILMVAGTVVLGCGVMLSMKNSYSLRTQFAVMILGMTMTTIGAISMFL